MNYIVYFTGTAVGRMLVGVKKQYSLEFLIIYIWYAIMWCDMIW